VGKALGKSLRDVLRAERQPPANFAHVAGKGVAARLPQQHGYSLPTTSSCQLRWSLEPEFLRPAFVLTPEWTRFVILGGGAAVSGQKN
jgi:hypothetical protein